MEKEQKIVLSRIIASGVLLAASYVSSFPVWLHVVLCATAYFIIGADVICKAIRNLSHGDWFDENFLMTLATIGAFVIGEYPEAVAVMLFYQIGELFSDIAVSRSRSSITALMDIRPDYANLEENDRTLRISPEEVPTGSVIVVKPGEKIPLDGKILSGVSTLDTAALTGESLPREVTEGDAVVSGSLNMTGLLRIRTTGTYGESTVAKILNLVENAGTSKATTEKIITRFARVYTPVVVVAAILLAVVPPVFTGGGWLVISCPCALVVSIPLTFFAGIGGASRRGILVKGSNYLELLARIRTVVFDKTGTLTRGDFSVTAVHPEIVSERKLVELAALAESYSDHPVAASLRSAYAHPIDKERIVNVENFAGEGIFACVDGHGVYAGNEKLMRRAGIEAKSCEKLGTIVHVAVDGKYMGHIIVSDSIKSQAVETIRQLKSEGVMKTVMLTGDRADVAEEVANALGIDEFHAGLLPADKVARMEALKAAAPTIPLAFVGDGINDAPVLKLADVGIAMGALGSDAAIEAADVVLMDDDPTKIAGGMRTARKTLCLVMQNIIFAIGVKFIMLLLGALGVANMWEAVFADVGVTVLAIANAMRAMQVKVK